MAEKAERSRPGLSVEAFRAFYQGRPDEERWEREPRWGRDPRGNASDLDLGLTKGVTG
jgi:hypothetical protein